MVFNEITYAVLSIKLQMDKAAYQHDANIKYVVVSIVYYCCGCVVLLTLIA